MTREEHIKQEAMRYADNPDIGVLESITAEHSFYDGAVYADQHPRKGLWDSEKVCEILHEIINSDTIVQYLIFDDENIDFDSELFFEDLRKAMED